MNSQAKETRLFLSLLWRRLNFSKPNKCVFRLVYFVLKIAYNKNLSERGFEKIKKKKQFLL